MLFGTRLSYTLEEFHDCSLFFVFSLLYALKEFHERLFVLCFFILNTPPFLLCHMSQHIHLPIWLFHLMLHEPPYSKDACYSTITPTTMWHVKSYRKVFFIPTLPLFLFLLCHVSLPIHLPISLFYSHVAWFTPNPRTHVIYPSYIWIIILHM